jgi:hypothetical protein
MLLLSFEAGTTSANLIAILQALPEREIPIYLQSISLPAHHS